MNTASLSFSTLLLLGSATFAESIDFYIGSTGKGKDGGIYLSSLDEDSGKISPPKQIVELAGTGFQALSPDGKSLLSTSQKKGAGTLSLFSIGEDRSLTLTGETSAQGKGACHVSFDHTGKVAMFADYGGGSVGSTSIGSDGSLAPLVSFFKHEGSSANPQRQKEPHAHSIFADPDNQYAYAPDLGTDKIEIYKIDTTSGALEKAGHAEVPPGSGPRHLKFSKDGKRIYVLNELNTSVSVFKRLTDGQLERVQDLSTLPADSKLEGMSCSEIRVHPNGKFVYTANRDTRNKGNDSITVFEVEEDGSLNRLSSVPATVSIPRNINLSPSGKWLITGGQNSNDIAIFSIDAETGALKKAGDNIPCPSPMCYVFLKED
ncbi:lactonase family protein [Haloferula chungangensis]|uniref:Lactonase family protein n=1 Tax=Haloferula chungangensis TaxID=1048331 RepID=A0ABW2L8W4_9BACT